MPWRQHSAEDRRKQDRADDGNRRRASDERQADHEREVREFREYLHQSREQLENLHREH